MANGVLCWIKMYLLYNAFMIQIQDGQKESVKKKSVIVNFFNLTLVLVAGYWLLVAGCN